MPYDIPRPSGYRIQPFKLQDDEALVASLANQLLKARLMEARAAAGGGGGRRGGGGGGKSGGSGKGEWRMVYNKDTKRYDKVWVEGKSKADREANIKGMDFNSAADRLEQNPEVSKLLGALRNPGASNLTKQEALKRFNALKSSEDFTGLNKEAVNDAFSQYTKPLEAEVKAEAKKIESSGRLGAIGTSLQNAWDRLATWAGSIGASDEEKIAASKASAERQAARREADPWLREQDLRLAEEPEARRGIMERTGGLANIATNAAETLVSDPGMGLALTGGAVASLGTGGLAAPLVGAGLAATGGAMSGDTFFRERLAQDPNLTDAQRAQAYGEGALQEQLVGAGLNLVPAVSPAAVRGARVAMAAKGLEGEAAQAARAARAAQLRSFGSVMKADVPLAAGEGAVVNAGQMALSNANYGDVTGQQVDLSENVPESALAGLAFGLATGVGSGVGAWRAGRAARRAGTQTQQTPPPSGGGAKPGDEASPEGAAAVLAKEAEAAASAQTKGKTQEAPAAASPQAKGKPQEAPAVASAEQQAPEATTPEPMQSVEPSQPQTPEAAASEPVQSSGPAPQDLPSFKKSEASRQKQAGKFEPDLGDAFEAKFRASKEYEGYARHEALRSSLAQSGAGTDAEQASLNAGIARATEGMRQWRERFILDNWDEAKAADKAAKEAKRVAARKEQEVRIAQEDLLKREERRQARPVSSGAANRSDVGWSGRPAQYGDWRDSIVPLPEGAAKVRFDPSTPPPVEVPAATQAASLETTGAGANEQALIQRLADIMGAGRRKAEAAKAAEAKPAAPAPSKKGKTSKSQPVKVDHPFTEKELSAIYTFSKKTGDATRNKIIQQNAFLQGEFILDKLDAARSAFRTALGDADYVFTSESGRKRTMKNKQLMDSLDQLAEQLQKLGAKRHADGPRGNDADGANTAVRNAGRLGEEIPDPENTGVHRGMEADTAPDAEASANRASEEAGVRREENQGERDGRRPGERAPETPHPESGARIKRAERESGSEESVGERDFEQPAETGARAGEGERGAEPAADAVAGGPAAGRSPAETVAAAVQPYLDYATMQPASPAYAKKTGLDYYGKIYPDADAVDSIRETFTEFYEKGRNTSSGRPDYWQAPKLGTEDYNWAVLNTLDPPFRDAQSRNFKFETSRWKDTPFSPEFFQTNFPDAWKSGKLDYDDVRMVMDPDSVRVENEAVLNGDKPVCS